MLPACTVDSNMLDRQKERKTKRPAKQNAPLPRPSKSDVEVSLEMPATKHPMRPPSQYPYLLQASVQVAIPRLHPDGNARSAKGDLVIADKNDSFMRVNRAEVEKASAAAIIQRVDIVWTLVWPIIMQRENEIVFGSKYFSPTSPLNIRG